MPSTKKLLQAAAGSAGGDPLYAEDVFSTYLYTGTGSAMTITNGVNLEDNGGIVWTKPRTSSGEGHRLIDADNSTILTSDGTNAKLNGSLSVPQYYLQNNTDGFDLVGNVSVLSGTDYASWTFRKAEKFFDVQAWTGNSTAGRTVAHNLGSAPKFVIVKRTDTANNWVCWHSGIAITKYLQINSTSPAYNDGGIFWDSTLPDASNITLGSDSGVNATGSTYVAYLFASDAGGFGDDGDENIIKCGSVTTDGSGDATVALGFEPQWVMLKRTDGAGSWAILDTMRGYDHNSSKRLQPNVVDAEENYTGTNILGVPTATGFTTSGPVLDANSDYIYVAIRRPMKTPEAGTEVFAPISLGTTTEPGFISNFVTDFVLHNTVDETGSTQVSSRMTGNKYMFSDATNAEGSISAVQWDFMNGSRVGNGTANADEIQWMFKRATGFMDAVAYKGNGTAGTAQAHNLGVVPEMMIGKNRSNSSNWMVYHTGATYTAGAGLKLNTTAAGVSNTYDFGNASGGAQRPDASSVYLGGNVNSTNDNYILYLFATLAGVSKVGSYTGTGADLNVDCGFSAGARFILIKRTDSTGDWYVYDSLRGIVAGNDPYLLLNSTAAEVTNTDYVDPLSSGFTVTSSAPAALNASGGTYIFLAIA